ncbi:MAG: elongation factor G [Bradymonadia bacterium]
MRVRNFGISAHIDSGKTTLAERVLYYTGRIHAMHEVRGADGVGATLDHDPLEVSHGISIQSAATSCQWNGTHINLIDTPGHVDFTVEVERALRVLDGAVLLLCAVGGVQAQTLTVARQMDRYGVPRIAFVNKCDRAGADPAAVVKQMRARLHVEAIPIQHPMGLESELEGVIDLVEMQAVTFEGEKGEHVRRGPIPEAFREAAEQARAEMLDRLSLFSDALTEALVEELEIHPALIKSVIRAGVVERAFVPVMMGSAYRNVGVQCLLDGVVDYLPAPEDIERQAENLEGETVPLSADAEGALAALVFKVQPAPGGALAWVRIYRGTLRAGDTVYHVRNGSRMRVGRVVRLHADRFEQAEAAEAGHIVAIAGAGCQTGDTLSAEHEKVVLESMQIPEPMVEAALHRRRGEEKKLSKALTRFCLSDPTLKVHTDGESGEIRLRGMGELHLEIYLERLKSMGLEVQLSAPTVAYRQTLGRRVAFNHLLNKQNGGAGMWARIIGYLEPLEDTEGFEFEWKVTGGAIPRQWAKSIASGFRDTLQSGIGDDAWPVQGVRVVIEDGATHVQDSSDMAFNLAAQEACRTYIKDEMLVLLEPLAAVEAEAPIDHQGAVVRTLMGRRGRILGTEVEQGHCRVSAEVPLADLFGYASALRSATAGTGSFSQAFARYSQLRAS